MDYKHCRCGCGGIIEELRSQIALFDLGVKESDE